MPLYKYEEQSTEDKKIAVIVDNFIFFWEKENRTQKACGNSIHHWCLFWDILDDGLVT